MSTIATIATFCIPRGLGDFDVVFASPVMVVESDTYDLPGDFRTS